LFTDSSVVEFSWRCD